MAQVISLENEAQDFSIFSLISLSLMSGKYIMIKLLDVRLSNMSKLYSNLVISDLAYCEVAVSPKHAWSNG